MLELQDDRVIVPEERASQCETLRRAADSDDSNTSVLILNLTESNITADAVRQYLQVAVKSDFEPSAQSMTMLLNAVTAADYLGDHVILTKACAQTARMISEHVSGCWPLLQQVSAAQARIIFSHDTKWKLTDTAALPSSMAKGAYEGILARQCAPISEPCCHAGAPCASRMHVCAIRQESNVLWLVYMSVSGCTSRCTDVMSCTVSQGAACLSRGHDRHRRWPLPSLLEHQQGQVSDRQGG